MRFIDYLRISRGCSPATIRTYSMAFDILYRYCAEKRNIMPTALDVEDLTNDLIHAFLNHLELVVGNSISTRNNRLAAVQSFFRFLAEYKPVQYTGQAQLVRAIRGKKGDKPETKYLTLPEAKLLIEATDIHTNCGVRDRAMLTTAIQTGVRSDEIRSLVMGDLRLEPPADIRIQAGKGRKVRTLPLHDNTVVEIRRWLDIRGHGDGPLFPSTHKKKMSEDAFGLIVRSNVEKVRAKHPAFPTKDISPHTLRHTAAMLMVDSGVGIETISLYLGHEDIRTTARYLHHNLNIKIRAMNRTTFPTTESALPPQSTQFVLSDSDREILKKLREND